MTTRLSIGVHPPSRDSALIRSHSSTSLNILNIRPAHPHASATRNFLNIRAPA